MGVTGANESSAKVLLRLPRALHAQLKRRAVDQGVSANTLMATLLAGAVGFALDDDTTRQEASMRDTSLKPTVNGATFARASSVNPRTFRRWLRDRGDGVGMGSEYELPPPDTPEGKRLVERFHRRDLSR